MHYTYNKLHKHYATKLIYGGKNLDPFKRMIPIALVISVSLSAAIVAFDEGTTLSKALIILGFSLPLFLLFYMFYLTAIEGFKGPVIFYNRIRLGHKKRSKNQRVNQKMSEFKIIHKEEENHLLGSIIILVIFVLIVFILLFDAIYLVAITSNSMKPTFEKGDLVLMQSVNKEPKEGDIILFNQKRYLIPITHRITSVTPEGVTTKGDAANPDPWLVKREDIQSKAVQIGGKPVVIKDLGEYFILETERQSYGKYGQEYTFIKNLFMVIKLYGYALCIIAVMGYLFLTIRESKS